MLKSLFGFVKPTIQEETAKILARTEYKYETYEYVLAMIMRGAV